jgi:predicted dehydrogenase
MGVLAAPWIIPASARGADGFLPPSERVAVGVIGLGAMGRGHVGYCLAEPAIQLVAVCDVDRVRRDEQQRHADAAYANAGMKGYRCAAYNDYRDMLARKDLDGVIIATPDHWHALQSVDAARAGKDVYCEKPVSLTIAQGRRIVEVVRRHACVFQTGTQYRSAPTIRRICEYVRSGGLGKVRHAFTLWSRVEGGYTPVSRALPAEPVPEGLDWDLWVGPAPWRPYNSAFHRNPVPGVVPWAFCEDFGAGAITWHHSHDADVVQYGLGVEHSGPVEIYPPTTRGFPTLTFRFRSGTLLHLLDDWGQAKTLYKAVPENARIEGMFGGVFVGETGWITSMTGSGAIEGGPPGIFEEMGMTNRQIPGGNNHHANWLECIRTRGKTSTGEEIGHRAASLGHLAIIAFRLRRRLKWDPAREEFDDAEANRMRSRAMREPWRM